MDLNAVLAAVTKMFPQADISAAIQKAQGILAGTPDSIDGARKAAANAGLSRDAVESIYNRYGRSVKARTVCSLLGTTPEALRDDALSIVSSGVGEKPAGFAQKPGSTGKKFPRLK